MCALCAEHAAQQLTRRQRQTRRLCSRCKATPRTQRGQRTALPPPHPLHLNHDGCEILAETLKGGGFFNFCCFSGYCACLFLKIKCVRQVHGGLRKGRLPNIKKWAVINTIGGIHALGLQNSLKIKLGVGGVYTPCTLFVKLGKLLCNTEDL